MNRFAVLFYFLLINIFLIIALILGIVVGNPTLHCEEGQFLTWVSFVQLMVVAGFNGFLFLRNRFNLFWLFIMLSFVFLGLDEIWKIHELLDYKIHVFMDWQETALTDRLDDFIVFIYAVLGAGFLFYHRKRLKLYKKHYFYLKCAFIVALLSIALDVITNRPDIVHNGKFLSFLEFCEESTKIYAEFFLVCFFGKVVLDNNTNRLSLFR